MEPVKFRKVYYGTSNSQEFLSLSHTHKPINAILSIRMRFFDGNGFFYIPVYFSFNAYNMSIYRLEKKLTLTKHIATE